MRTPLLAKICPLLAALLTTAAAVGAPRLVLPETQVAPSGRGAPARAREVLTARAPASAALSLAHVATLSRPGGQKLVRFAQSHVGIPVLSRGASVLLDAQGNPTSFATAKLAEQFPASSSPSLAAAVAAQRAEGAFRGARFDAGDARLAWLPRARDARLVWVLYRGLIPGTPYSPVVAVDAHSGNTLLAYDATRFDRAATVYDENPVSTPTAAAVTLSSLAQGATKLEDARIRSVTCVDTQQLFGKGGIHWCELIPKAVADTNGDFPYTFSSDTAPEDEFAEVSMYFHTAKAYAFYESLGMPELELKPLTTVANLRFPQGWDTFSSKIKDPNLPLQPYDNAFFSPQSPFPGLFKGIQGGLFFGQGTLADFAYDGDVVYHELGHALTDRTIDLVSHWLLDEQGASPAPGAMNEALADYFSSALTGDGKVGEYAAKNTSFGLGDKVIRDLDNDESCPKNLAGEVHGDSPLFSGALWSVRQALPEADRGTFDKALITAMLGAPSGELSYEGLGELFRAAVEASTLGKTAADALATELTKRGVLPSCVRVLEYKGQELSSTQWKFGSGYFSPGKPYAGLEQTESYAPGLLQIHAALKTGTEKLKIQWQNIDLGSQYSLGPDADPYTPGVLVRFAKDSIVFNYDAGVASNADGLFDTDGFSAESATVDVPKDATDAWVMIVNKGDEPGLFRAVELLQKTTATGGTGGTSGSGGFGGAGTGGLGGIPVGTGGGFDYQQELRPVGGCSSSGDRGSLGCAGGLVLGALVLARRRRRPA